MKMIPMVACAAETVSKRLDKWLWKLGIAIRTILLQKISWQHQEFLVMFRAKNVGGGVGGGTFLLCSRPWTVCNGLLLYCNGDVRSVGAQYFFFIMIFIIIW